MRREKLNLPDLRPFWRLAGLPLLGIIAAALGENLLIADWSVVLGMAVWALCIAGTAIAWRFRMGLVMLSFMALAAAHLLSGALAEPPATIPTLDIGLLWYLPIILTLLGVLPEQALTLNRDGVLRMAAVVLPPLSIAAHAVTGSATPGWLLWSAGGGAPLVPVVLGLAGFTTLVVTLIRRRGPLDAAQLAVLVLALWAVREGSDVHRHWVLAVAACVLLTGVVQAGYRVAFHDELTGLPGRRALKSLLAGVGDRYVIAMLDVDHFKKFNDTYGHDVGDQVLCRVARVVEAVTGGGRAFRYGGEEFTIVFPDRTVTQALPHLDKVRAAMAATPFMVRGPDRPEEKPDQPQPNPAAQQVQITISIGAAERSAEVPGWEAVMKAADQALYKAKQAGRNRVMAADGRSPTA